MDPVIIIGSGLGGLALAQGFYKASIPFKIYERDRSENIRRQGYRIRLHGEGLRALRSLLVNEIWDLFEETCAETILGSLPIINAQTCEISAATFKGNNPQSRVLRSDEKPHTVDRGILREVLLTRLDENIIYGKEYTSCTLTDAGIVAKFADGTSEMGSLLVGADGVRSAVRRQHFPHLKVLDTKTRPIYGKTPLTESFRRGILPKSTECLSLIEDPQTGNTTLMEVIHFVPKDQRTDKRDLPDDYVYWVIIPSNTDRPKTSAQPSQASGEQPAELARSMTAHWHPSVRPLIEYQDPSQTGIFRLLSSDPESLKRRWEPDARVTLLGDAAHAMMPSTASGAVTTLRDAELLSSLIADQGVGRETIARYEERMREYAGEAVASSAAIGEMSFGMRALADCEPVSW